MKKSARKRCCLSLAWVSRGCRAGGLGCLLQSPLRWLPSLTLASPQVLSYSQLCVALGVKQESPEPPSFLSTGEIHAFLSSPSGRRTKR